MSMYDPDYIDDEEKELLEDIADINPETLPRPTDEEQRMFKDAAKAYVGKETKMNIRIDPYELGQIKEQAKKEGLRYQTFIKSILHKYMTGQLIERGGKAG